jgi:hypothetical protein
MTFFGMALLTAVGTVVLAVFAIVTAWYARRAYLAQSKQLQDQITLNKEQTGVLKLQARELDESLTERKREREERHRAQASRVFIWQGRGPILSGPPAALARGANGGGSVVAHVVNTSEQPIYDVIIGWFNGDHPENPVHLDKPIMPGDEYSATITVPLKRDPERYEATAHFRDATKVNWRIWTDGRIEEQQANDAHSD